MITGLYSFSYIYLYIYFLFIFLECMVVDSPADVPNNEIIASISNITDRATSPIPGCSNCKKYLIIFIIILSKIKTLYTSSLQFFSYGSIDKYVTTEGI